MLSICQAALDRHLNICSTHYNQAFSTIHEIFTDYGLALPVRAELLPIQILHPMSWRTKQYCQFFKKQFFHDNVLWELADQGTTYQEKKSCKSCPSLAVILGDGGQHHGPVTVSPAHHMLGYCGDSTTLFSQHSRLRRNLLSLILNKGLNTLLTFFKRFCLPVHFQF